MSFEVIAAIALCILVSASLGNLFEKRNRHPKNALHNLQGAIYISQSNESLYNLQDILEDYLTSHGMKILRVSQQILLELLKTGKYPRELTELMIDVIIVGRIFSVPCITQKVIRNRWYEKGRKAAQLGFEHTMMSQIYGSNGDLIKIYHRKVESEDFASAFNWLSADLTEVLYQELKK